jgi:DNA repair exonuclease SbcCD ATPase subunit
MRIKRMEIHHFRCFPHLRLDFVPGFNVVKGPNGAGKSTIQRAIVKALFDRPTKTKVNEQDRSWGAPDLYTLELELESSNTGRWIVRKNFESSRTQLHADNGDRHYAHDSVQRKLYSLIGVGAESLYTSTVFVAQSELAAIDDGRKDITRSLEERVAGGDHGIDTQTVIRKLDKAITDYRRGYETRTYSNFGHIARLITEQSELGNRIAELRRRFSQQVEDMENRDRLQARLDQSQSELTSQSRLLEAEKQVREIRRNLQSWSGKEQELEERLSTIAKAQDDLQSAAIELQSLAAFSALDESEIRRLDQLHAQVEYLQSIESTTPVLPATNTAPTRTPVFLIGLAAVVAIGMIWLRLSDSANISILVAGYVLSVLLFAVGLVWLLFNRWRTAYRNKGTNSAHLTVLGQRGQEIASAQRALQDSLRELGADNWQDYEAKRIQARVALTRKEQAQIRLDTLLGVNRTRDQIEQERQQASRERRDLQEKLQEPNLQRVDKLTPVELETIAVQLQRNSAEQAQVKSDLDRIRFRLQENPVNQHELLQAEERAEDLAQDIARCQNLLAVYQHTRDTLVQAREVTIQRLRSKLETDASLYFNRLTGGQYRSVSIDSEFSLRVARAEDNEPWIEPSLLSCGTRDQLYFAARLALADRIFEGRNPPLFLDDPFVSFDRQRRELACQLCSEIARNRQVLLFTCSDDYDHLGHVIELA